MENVEKAALPPGWVWVRLGDISAVSGGLTKNRSRNTSGMTSAPFLRVANVQSGSINLESLHFIEASTLEIERLSLRPGDVLVVEGNGSLSQVGRCAIWDNDLSGCIHQNHIIRVRLDKPEQAHWVFRWLSSKYGRTFIERLANSTSGLHTLSISKVESLPVPIAPEREQGRIMGVLESSLDDVGDVEAAMNRARGQVADYGTSLLHAACTGALTADWRAANPHPAEDGAALLRRIMTERRTAWERAELARLNEAGKVPRGEGWKARYPSTLPIALDDAPSIPKTWTWVSLDQLAFAKGYGTSAKCDANGSGSPVLRIPNVQAGEINFKDLKRSRSELDLSAREYLALGDLLIVRTNGSPALIGRAALVERAPASATYFASYLIRFRLISMPTLQKWVSRMFASGLIRSQVIQFAATSAGQYNVSQSSLARLAIPLPPIAEIEIALKMLSDGQLNLADMPEIGEVADLRQSLLHAAFSGRLVPQDPADEPANIQLARVRTRALPSAPRRRALQAKAALS